LSALHPLRLSPSWREKIWGSRDLTPLFEPPDRKIGEVWYTFEENTVAAGRLAGRTLAELMRSEGPALMGTSFRPRALKRRVPGGSARAAAAPEAYFPILVKFLFTSDKLSVQVHPDDAYALAHEDGPGKTEMWYVLRADPGGAVALGLSERLTPDQLRQAALSGEIVRYLNWRPVRPGDVVFCPPGTLHAIGPGLALCEIQQNSDLTYRFYDFGRLGDDGQPRTLHIEQGVAVARLEPHVGPLHPSGDRLVACDYFTVDRLRRSDPARYEPDPARFHILVFLEGSGTLGSELYRAGDVFLMPASLPSFDWLPAAPTLALLTYVPGD
jgi:mannose-6-phosphate isomerase